ncbi:CinA family protein [Alteromonas lipolytica]|uniref:Damage-inducible protein CinA n=1 Tax=Alteromonas lipolytica TaxID=1856405 RepID=A0A1E8F9L6_9ALTE|nr:nicotinamide-nucleotide amidohydrolase family protein [Alteromonas lipolytica]OFI32607.1 damage-inducible protein CinA [Alteromonas lipolytica]GGF74711.1 competence damage-inducible protein A [Alteromonas lipolytica]
MSQSFSTLSRQQLDINVLAAQIFAIGDVLRQRGWTVSCAESCTGGGIAYALTSVAGSSDWFRQSFVTYSNTAKHALVGVEQATLEQFGAVSSQVVLEMAEGTAREAQAECALAVSGIAGPGGGSTEKPVGTVWFGIHIDGKTDSVVQQFDGDREAVRTQAIAFAIATLHHRLVDAN